MSIFKRDLSEKDLNVLNAIEEIELEMKKIGFWNESPPKIKKNQEFLHGLSFELWLQCVFIPNAKEAAKKGSYPKMSQVGVMAMRQYDYHSCVEEALNLVSLLHQFDKLVMSSKIANNSL